MALHYPLRPQAPSRHISPPAPSFLDLPEDVVDTVVRVVSRVPENPSDGGSPASCVDAAGFARGLRLALTCRSLADRFFTSLDAVTLPSVSTLSDDAVASIARRAGPATQRLVLRSCASLTDSSALAVAACMTSLRAVDFSFVPHITDTGVTAICGALGDRLEKLLLRKCTKLTDVSLGAIGTCTRLETLDISHVGPALTDEGVAAMVAGCGRNLRLLSISNNPSLSDDTFFAIGAWCANLVQICARCLPLVSDTAFEALCQGIGHSVRGVDVIDCPGLSKGAVVSALTRYCPAISLIDPENHSLRHVLISGLRTNIFIVRGIDPMSKMDTVHTCLVDTGDIASACILMAGTTDLSLVSLVLAKNFGTALDEMTVQMLSNSYGLPTELLH